MKRILLTIAAAVCLTPATALACDDHIGECKIEAWRWQSLGDMLTLDGSATCDSGMAAIRLYDGDTFLGVANGLIEGHALQAVAHGIEKPANLMIKYSIELW